MVSLSLTLLCLFSLLLSFARGRLGRQEKHARLVEVLGSVHPLLVVGLLGALLFMSWQVVLTSPAFIVYLCLPLVFGVLYGFQSWRRRHPGAISRAFWGGVRALVGRLMGRRSYRRRPVVAVDPSKLLPKRSYTGDLLWPWVQLALGKDSGRWVVAHQVSVLVGALLALNVPAGGLGFVGGEYLLPLLPAGVSFARWRKKDASEYGQVLAGNQVLLDAKIIKTLDPINKDVWLEKGELKSVLHLDKPIPGVPTAQAVTTLGKFTDHMNAVRTRTTRTGADRIQIEYYHQEPLDDSVVIHEPLAVDPKKMRITCAVNSLGDKVAITLGDASGMVIGGIPGSGKTAGATSFLLPLALSEHVDMSIIDGKGGEDWVNYRGVVSKFIKGDTDLVPIYDYISQFSAQMYERLDTLKSKLGTSNFWNATPEQRLEAGVPLKLLVIDECQGIFQPRKLKVERENEMTDMDMIAEITRLVEDLIKRGRSAGIFVILMTQKPTADAMPTAIRDNAGLRIAFHVQTQAAEMAILGVSPKDVPGMPSAVSIPAHRKGGAVLATDTGDYEMVRFFYIPEADQERVLAAGKIHKAAEAKEAGGDVGPDAAAGVAVLEKPIAVGESGETWLEMADTIDELENYANQPHPAPGTAGEGAGSHEGQWPGGVQDDLVPEPGEDRQDAPETDPSATGAGGFSVGADEKVPLPFEPEDDNPFVGPAAPGSAWEPDDPSLPADWGEVAAGVTRQPSGLETEEAAEEVLERGANGSQSTPGPLGPVAPAPGGPALQGRGTWGGVGRGEVPRDSYLKDALGGKLAAQAPPIPMPQEPVGADSLPSGADSPSGAGDSGGPSQSQNKADRQDTEDSGGFF